MTLVDTSVWIDFFRNRNASLSSQLAELLEGNFVTGLSAVFGELIQGCRSEEEERIVLEFWNNLPKVDETELFIEAGKLSNRYKLFSKGVGLIDCYLLAAVRVHNLNLWTLDKKLIDVYNKISR